jgi:hypothetical protein
MLYTSLWAGDEPTTSVVIGTVCIGSCKSNYHTSTATTPPEKENGNKTSITFYSTQYKLILKDDISYVFETAHVKRGSMNHRTNNLKVI